MQEMTDSTWKKNEKQAYSVMTTHSIYISLIRKHGLDVMKRNKQTQCTYDDDMTIIITNPVDILELMKKRFFI